jgi:hypothetical protein
MRSCIPSSRRPSPSCAAASASSATESPVAVSANRNAKAWRGATENGLNDGRIPNPNVVRVAPGTGYHRVEGNRRASRNGLVSDCLPNPYRSDSQLSRRCTHRPRTSASAPVSDAGAYAVHTGRGRAGAPNSAWLAATAPGCSCPSSASAARIRSPSRANTRRGSYANSTRGAGPACCCGCGCW